MLRLATSRPHVAAGTAEGARRGRRLTPEQRTRIMLERAIVEAIDLLDEIDAATADIEDDDPAGTDLDAGEHDEAEREGDDSDDEPEREDEGAQCDDEGYGYAADLNPDGERRPAARGGRAHG